MEKFFKYFMLNAIFLSFFLYICKEVNPISLMIIELVMPEEAGRENIVKISVADISSVRVVHQNELHINLVDKSSKQVQFFEGEDARQQAEAAKALIEETIERATVRIKASYVKNM